ncbi:MAG: hypothetical protein HC933_23135, partial [Pleurocapsa sp. SU_196_0]|nr:hypothetical protein [Pleurocapsa sp. SU_196_0]
GQDVAVDSSGNIVVVGYTDDAVGTVDFAVARLLDSGLLDNSFDTDGRQTIDFAGGNTDEAYGVKIGSDNSVIVAGKSVNGDDDMAVARLTSSGALDLTFDTDGRQTASFAVSSNEIANAVTVDSSGNVFLAGYTTASGNVLMAVTKFTASGAFDNTFDMDGRQTLDFSGTDERANAILLDSSGRIVIVGTSDAADIKFAVARLSPAGGLDSSFNGTGKLRSDYSGSGDTGNGGVLDASGKIVVAGSRQSAAFGVARINP